jgi:hypothetical protein
MHTKIFTELDSPSLPGEYLDVEVIRRDSAANLWKASDPGQFSSDALFA